MCLTLRTSSVIFPPSFFESRILTEKSPGKSLNPRENINIESISGLYDTKWHELRCRNRIYKIRLGLAKIFAFLCSSLPKIYLKFTLLELCQQFSRLSTLFHRLMQFLEKIYSVFSKQSKFAQLCYSFWKNNKAKLFFNHSKMIWINFQILFSNHDLRVQFIDQSMEQQCFSTVRRH